MVTVSTRRAAAADRRAAILEAAGAVFFEQGYAATSIDSIIERLGGSKRNIYNEFGSKEGLFTALVEENANAILAGLSLAAVEHRDLRETLLDFGRRLMRIYLSPALLGVYRTIVSEGLRFPKLAQAFYDKGPARASFHLCEMLEKAKREGEVEIEDCAAAADHFAGMLRDNLYLRVVLGISPPPTAREIEAAVTSAVDIFLNGVTVRSRGHA
ncbi:TetR/AcrR family transcriptional regulator C-terminal domain-containing protein [Roseixanthobacter glucoisosaccharinicivorans]|uniref:TetR/AcrR family transcriptional regulator C-terminal domain-containing protein n=1 Tax=Roseixanthobacter glucoisosaccharinicivorans TaxID=3119923 RepID=UPI003727142A